ncbi:hypothetical protein [Pontibacillus yanchengensis]|uniref:Lipoprotein n=1 Tax=Pontibacillus yanchengensis Y32 TaxID=1385514 RepID=A0A0A2THM7_9BACI|nr:hypothetical protein [Pontibacillus yanchengensis]KGP73928.1 hypothetical protein N782_21275 [Pontibacillus yanchengensis Y32]
MKRLIIGVILFTLVACHSVNNEKLKINNLDKVNTAKNDTVTMYEASSMKEALIAIPFELHLPKEIPKRFGTFDEFTIIDFKDKNDQKDIGIRIGAKDIREGAAPDYNLIIFARDFEASFVDRFKDNSELHELGDNQSVYVHFPSIVDANFANLFWRDNGILFEIKYDYEKGKDKRKVRETLLHLAEQMQ